MTLRRSGLALGLACAATLLPRVASAFCGFYVGGADSSLYNHATQVVLMREGLRTVLSMENNYEGPSDGFAMVVPVPVVLQKENVKTLTHELFDRIDLLDAPRLVEYWERDPCAKDEYGYEFSDDPLNAGGFGPSDATLRVRPAPPVQVLNRFTAGEYQIVILGAQDSLALDTWLRQNGYRIPSGAEAALRPYVQAGMKFFVARVDPTKVRFENGMATLSPLRFHYDTETFGLPIRLGLLSSAGVQDLIVHILAEQRYEVANYDNLFIPTNLDVTDAARSQFGAFYAALFDHTLADKPHAMVTEYSWGSSTCDPCPASPLEPADLAAFGGDVLPEPEVGVGRGFILTRLHARYDKASLGADLVFRAAPPITGGREQQGEKGTLEKGASRGGMNNFQARYAIRHPWGGAVTCAEPHRGQWRGGPGFGVAPPTVAAQNLAFAPRGSIDFTSFLGPGLPDSGGGRTVYALPTPLPPPVQPGGCASCRVGTGALNAGAGNASDEGGPRAALAAFLLAAAALLRRPSKRA